MVGDYFHMTKARFKRRNTFSFSTECCQLPDAIRLFCRMQVRVFDITTSLEQLSLGFEKNLGAVNKLGGGGGGVGSEMEASEKTRCLGGGVGGV